MCLYHTRKATKEFRQKMQGVKTFTAYKVYRTYCRFGRMVLQPLCLYNKPSITGPQTVISDRDKKAPGKDKSDRYNEVTKPYTNINRGIHVCLSKRNANSDCRLHITYVVVAVRCDMADLVGVSDPSRGEEAVFMKVEITERAWKEAAKRLSKKSRRKVT